MAVKIKLKRLGKIRNPQYRVVIADARNKRDGRSIEEIGLYHPKEQPSLIQIDSERVQYWLGVGAQPTEAVLALLKVTGDWQKFKGEAGAEGTLQTREEKADRKTVFAAAAAEAAGLKDAEEKAPKKAKAEKAPAEEAPVEEAKAEDAPAEETPAEAPAAEAADEAPAADAGDDTQADG